MGPAWQSFGVFSDPGWHEGLDGAQVTGDLEATHSSARQGLGWVALAERTESLGPAVPPSFKAWIFPFHSLRFPLLATWPPPPKGEKAGS